MRKTKFILHCMINNTSSTITQALEFFLTRALLPSPQDCDLGDPLVTALAVASNGNEGQIVTTDAASMGIVTTILVYVFCFFFLAVDSAVARIVFF